MKGEEQLIEQEIESIMEQGREIPPTPDVVRARLLSRARSAFAASKASAGSIPTISTPPLWRGRRVALAASLLLMLATVAVAAAFHARATLAPEIAPTPPRVPAPAVIADPGQGLPSRRTPPAVSSLRIQRPHRLIAPQESYAAELHLLQRAQSEYAGRDFVNALVLLAEHRHRFPSGRLAEEREALRVESLAHAGRDAEARRALAAFANRFPHSAFLPRLRAAAPSTEE